MSLILMLSDRNQNVPPGVNFIIGGVSGVIGQTATHPLDVIKVGMQITKKSLSGAIRDTLKECGLRGFYVGWGAGFLRQLNFSAARLGFYTVLYDFSQSQWGCLNFTTMVGLGMISGIMSSFIGTPTDLVLVRMVADVHLPPDQRWNYRNIGSAWLDIWETEGLCVLWRGAVPTMARAAIVTGSQLGTFSKAKLTLQETERYIRKESNFRQCISPEERLAIRRLLRFIYLHRLLRYLEEGMLLDFCSAMISGLAVCTTSLPVDVVKTRIQKWDSPNVPPGIIEMMVNIGKKEGILSLWRGFLPYYARSAPITVITMMCVNEFHRIYTDLFISSE